MNKLTAFFRIGILIVSIVPLIGHVQRLTVPGVLAKVKALVHECVLVKVFTACPEMMCCLTVLC
jgi:hypothetical protein